jgi:hypothetical protein
MSDSEIDRIRRAEVTVRDAIKKAAELRKTIEKTEITDPPTRARLIEAAEKFEADVQNLKDSLERWKKEIN